MVGDGIIAPVTEPTRWVSSMIAMKKKKNKLRICLDPRDLNKAIQRSHYPLPTLEDVATRLNKAKVFSVLDAKSGFWQVKLDEDSSYLTTFNTPFGRYRWLRMPFGINSAPEEWQRRAHELAEGLEGVEVVADDFLCIGFGATVEEATRDHDANVRELLERARACHLVLNPDKVKLRSKSVPFIGHILTDEGLKVDESKVEAIMKMPAPTYIAALKRILGIVGYLAKFLPHLSEVCEPLRQGTPFNRLFVWEIWPVCVWKTHNCPIRLKTAGDNHKEIDDWCAETAENAAYAFRNTTLMLCILEVKKCTLLMHYLGHISNTATHMTLEIMY